MATQRLVIDSLERGEFVLRVDGDGVTIGASDGTRVLEHLRVTHIHCVLQIESEQVTVRDEAGGAPQVVKPGQVLKGGGGHFSLQAIGDTAAAVGPRTKKRLLAIAGPEDGRGYVLPESGVVTIGKERKQADIVLRGMLVEAVHCRLRIDGDKIEVIDEGSLDTLVNGKRVSRQELKPGDVLRIGAHQLRLEAVGLDEEFATSGIPKREAKEDEELAEEPRPMPANASESVKLLHQWRDKLAELTGEEVGHYKLGPVLGRGRGGVVFLATDTKGGGEVALKVFSPQFPSGIPELQRFAGVMKVMIPLRHPNVVTVHAAGKNAPFTWLAREYIEGESVARIIRRQARDDKFNVGRACRVGVDVAQALDFARQHQLRHGALTPAAILLRESDKSALLADLMLATALQGSQLGQTILDDRSPTDVAYLSPEQATPGAFVDESSDLYALGAVIYALLTGRPPFVGDSATAVLEQVRGPARAPRPRTLNEDVPENLERVVLKLLAKLQEDRYPNPAQLLADLEPVAEELGVEA